MLDIKEYLKQTKTVLLTQDAFDELMQMAYAQPKRTENTQKTCACDLISRQAVTDTVRKIILGFFSDEDGVMTDTEKTLLSVNKAVCNGVRALPSAQPERTGRWIIRDNPGTGWYRITCSECGEDVTATAPCIGFFPNAKVNWDYCPNCGSYNSGDDGGGA